MTDYTLDVAKWRCGGDGPNRLGEGKTRMLNNEGFSCCLGQFAKQVGVADYLLGWGTPGDVANAKGNIYDPIFVHEDKGLTENTTLARLLMAINDNEDTAPREKITRIREELEAEGHTLTVLNEDMLPP